MEAQSRDLRKIFGGDKRYVVPLFQRPYVWNETGQWQPLWQDIQRTAESCILDNPAPHFLGALVLAQVPQPTGDLETRLVIDGQQRLTTVQIFLEAFADFASDKDARRAKILKGLTRNREEVCEDDDHRLKFWPTNLDHDHYRTVMNANNPEVLLQKYEKDGDTSNVHKLAACYIFFYKSIEGWIDESPGEEQVRLDALSKAVTELLQVVVIDLARDDDQQMIFEALNARGTPLQPSDLIKNAILAKAGQHQKDLETIYNNTWRHFDESMDYWRKLVGRGNSERQRLDMFLHAYLSAKTAEQIEIRSLNSTFQKKLLDGQRDPHALLHDIRSYASTYKQFDNPQSFSSLRIRRFFERLSQMEMTTAHPFLVELFQKHGNNTGMIVTILDDIESYLVRRMVCSLTTKNYGRQFLDLISCLANSHDVAAAVRSSLLSSDSAIGLWPDDDEFSRAWLSEPIYNRLLRTRLQMILKALDEKIVSRYGQDVIYTGKFSIEHILPQKWEEHWPLADSANSESAILHRKSLVHTIGNLTLVQGQLNPALSNAAWPRKREKIYTHNKLNLNSALLGDPRWREEWNEEAIETRSHDLLQLALGMWPHPVARQTVAA